MYAAACSKVGRARIFAFRIDGDAKVSGKEKKIEKFLPSNSRSTRKLRVSSAIRSFPFCSELRTEKRARSPREDASWMPVSLFDSAGSTTLPIEIEVEGCLVREILRARPTIFICVFFLFRLLFLILNAFAKTRDGAKKIKRERNSIYNSIYTRLYIDVYKRRLHIFCISRVPKLEKLRDIRKINNGEISVSF